MFNNNINIIQKKSIKTLTQKHQHIIIKPNYKTTIINNIPLNFTNIIKHKTINIINTSNTKLQKVTYQINQLKTNISQTLKTNKHNLNKKINKISMLFTLNTLTQNNKTHIIILISKPPSPIITQTILKHTKTYKKPIIINFLNTNPHNLTRPNITTTTTLTNTTNITITLLNNQPLPTIKTKISYNNLTILQNTYQHLPTHHQTIHNIFTKKTFYYKTQLIYQQKKFNTTSNTPITNNHTLTNI